MKQKVMVWLSAVIVTYVIAVIWVSQLNILRITEMGYTIHVEQRFEAIGHDLMGMLSIYLPVIALALLIAFVVNSVLVLRIMNYPALLFPLAGFVALISSHVILAVLFGVAGIAPTRTLAGLCSQGLAGAVGGYVYYYLLYCRFNQEGKRAE